MTDKVKPFEKPADTTASADIDDKNVSTRYTYCPFDNDIKRRPYNNV